MTAIHIVYLVLLKIVQMDAAGPLRECVLCRRLFTRAQLGGHLHSGPCADRHNARRLAAQGAIAAASDDDASIGVAPDAEARDADVDDDEYDGFEMDGDGDGADDDGPGGGAGGAAGGGAHCSDGGRVLRF